jgi:hypothetical protein
MTESAALLVDELLPAVPMLGIQFVLHRSLIAAIPAASSRARLLDTVARTTQ